MESDQQGRPIIRESLTLTARRNLNFKVGKEGDGRRSVVVEVDGVIFRTEEECEGTA